MYAKPTCRPSARLEMRVRRPTPACGMQVRVCARAKSLPLWLTLCDPMDCSLPGSSVHGILQARKLEWVAIPSSSGSSQPRDGSHDSFLSCIGRRVLYKQAHVSASLLSSVMTLSKVLNLSQLSHLSKKDIHRMESHLC